MPTIYSTFSTRTGTEKLRAGPVWDSISHGNDLSVVYFVRSKTNLWYFETTFYNNAHASGATFSQLHLPLFLSRRWNGFLTGMDPEREVREALSMNWTLLSEAVARDCQRWGKASNQGQG
jgi:hypothetical protein